MISVTLIEDRSAKRDPKRGCAFKPCTCKNCAC